MVQGNDGVRRYSIDVRLFFATVTIAMSIAFAVGVMMGPDGTFEIPVYVPPTVPLKGELNEWKVLEERTIEVEQPPDDGEYHAPAGQHLLVDIKGVDGDFLDSEERLSQAMVDAVKAGGLTLLSYHCHKLIPSGVSCVGVLLESHISFHTWPEDGVITLDLFTCGPKPLLPVVETLEELFGIGEDTETRWSHELRGFREKDPKSPTAHLENDSDLAFWVLSPMDMHTKKKIFSGSSKYQKIDIWDIVEIDDTPSWEDVQKHNLEPGDPRWLTPEIATPDRLLFLDGTLQSISSSEREYHEAMVHPAMFAHPGPKQVAILGGGEGATLREVLKHKTVDKVTMIDIDEMLVELSRIHLPKMSDCSNLEGVAENCFDDERASVLFEDGRQWFLDRYGPQANVKPTAKFDVVVMDALDPEDPSEFSEQLYTEADFVSALMNALTEEGVLAVQIGTAPNINDPRADMGVYAQRETFINLLEANEMVQAIHVYEEADVGFMEPHSFLIACKSYNCRSRWYAESDAVDYQIYERIALTKDDKRALVQFDGSTQHQYKYPPKAWETVYCRREPTPFECAFIHLDPDRELFDFVVDPEEGESSFTVVGEYETGLKVEALVDVPEGSYIMPSHLASSFLISDKTVSNLETNTEVAGKGNAKIIEDLLEYIEYYGHKSFVDGIGINVVEIGGTHAIPVDDEKANIARWVPTHPDGKRPTFSPVYDRHWLSFDVFLVATKDIKKGDFLYKPKDLWHGKEYEPDD
mmetsp:Transcript_4703/g.6526  ORF Transcript_4703/g.6526 Transcript_4703/m.6526 type:complete len:752 (-) Transcript_4703:59-2314(-)|eukprot:CAMPEP_0194026544 /NCGR_PEP_ID=MMETSP0009_2-20130614/837_1 /TAXON_ID=210454 /ORGANISM="Grammatophora oceanica, Strain CCMP 410" /LENGTH=751 /DNA_ID=CAMNT_0038665281 /DNA_START=40 /DNA_END=2295 /DNA_ORIENTATION=-